MPVNEEPDLARLAALRAEIDDLQRRYPAERPGPAAAADPAPLPCPSCGGTMLPGTASVRGTILGFLVAGVSYQHLFFRPAGGGRKSDRVVVGSGDSSRAWRCDRCGAVLVRESKQAWTAG